MLVKRTVSMQPVYLQAATGCTSASNESSTSDRRVSCAATGLPRSTLSGNGVDTQSRAFLSTPGIEPLYSGVAISSASAASICSLSSRTGAGRSPGSERSPWNGGMAASSVKRTSWTPAGACSSAARRSRVFSESGRRLPEMVSTRMVLRPLHERQAAGELDGVVEQCAAARQRGIPGDAMLLAVDLALEVDADPLVAPAILVGAVDLGRQRDRPADALQGQLALDAVGCDQGAREGRLRVALDVEEVGRLEVPVAGLVIRDRACGLDAALDAGLLAALQRGLEIQEAAAHGGNLHVADAELERRVGGVDGVAADRDGRGCNLNSAHGGSSKPVYT